MIELKGKKYKICVLDTCIISEFFKDKETLGNRIITKFLNEDYFFAYTYQNFEELIKAPDIFDELFKYMSVMSTHIVKNHNQLLEDEINEYPNLNRITPFVLHVPMLQDSEYYEKLKNVFYTPKSKEIFKSSEKEAPSILNDLLSWVDKYPSTKGKYFKKEIELWVELITYKRILEIKKSILTDFVDKKTPSVDEKKFLSWTTIGYVTFYKFYFKHRKPRLSDLNDILMSSSYPYVDAVIIEKDMADTLKTIQKKHNFIQNLEIMTLDDFR